MYFFRKRVIAGEVKALFLHIQKTAGTSLVNVARPFYDQNISSHGEYWGRSYEQLKDIGFISGHIGYHFAKQFMGQRFSFTFLRDPGERILSMYYFCKGQNPNEFEIYKKAHDLDLQHFLEAAQWDPCIRMHIWNNQVWQLAYGYTHLDTKSIDDFDEAELLNLAKNHLLEFNFFGFTETFDADAAVILAKLGLPKTKHMPRFNDSPYRSSLLTMAPDIRLLIDELTALDRKLYQFALERRASAKSVRNRK
jgi:hypothetical protein